MKAKKQSVESDCRRTPAPDAAIVFNVQQIDQIFSRNTAASPYQRQISSSSPTRVRAGRTLSTGFRTRCACRPATRFSPSSRNSFLISSRFCPPTCRRFDEADHTDVGALHFRGSRLREGPATITSEGEDLAPGFSLMVRTGVSRMRP